MRLIDADAFDKMLIEAQAKCKKSGGNFRVGVLGNVRANLALFPTVDRPEIVRCKDCAKWDKSTMEHYDDVISGSGDTAECRMFCDMDSWGEFTDDMRRTDGNWYCADGERRTEDEQLD